jgi:cell wall assembly regulator SMI1
MQNDAVANEWDRIKRWLRANAPSWLDEGGAHPLFHPPASEAELAKLESHLGFPIPGELRSLLRIHDGCRQGPYPLPIKATSPAKWRLTPIGEIIESRELGDNASKIATAVKLKTVGPVHAVWWSSTWVPVAEDGTGDLVCIDTDPPPGGVRNQLVLYAHDYNERKVVYPSFLAWLRECANDFEAGEYVYEAGLGIYPKDQAPRG